MSQCILTSTLSPLQRAVIEQLGHDVDADELSEDCLSELSEIANHSADAGWSGFIYYTETIAFYIANKRGILALLGELADDLGESKISLVRGFNCLTDRRGNKRLPLYSEDAIGAVLYRPLDEDNSDHTQIANALAWFALEETARQLSDS